MFQFRPRLEEHRTPVSNYNPQQQNRTQPGNQGQQNLLPPPNLPRQRVDTEKENQKLQQSAENLTLLHSKLHDEAERIRYWKKSTELEIKQKDKKLDDAMQTIDSLRKSILELQFQNENISTKLQETKSHQEETVHRITTTRDMCNALKEHVVKIEENIVRGEADRDDLRFLDKERIDQIQSLVLKFQDIEIGCTAKNDQTRNKLSEIENNFEQESKQLREEISTYQTKIRNLDEMRKTQDQIISSLKDDINEFKEQIQHASEGTSNLSKKLTEVEISNHSLQEDVSKRQKKEEQLLVTIEELRKNNDIITENKLQLEDELRVARNALSKLKDESELKMNDLTEQINTLQKDLLDEKSRYGETCEDLNSKKNELESLRTNINLKEQECRKALEDCSISAQENENLQKQITEISDELRRKTEEMKAMKKNMTTADSMRSKIDNNNKSLSKKLEKVTEECQSLKKRFGEIEGENKRLVSELSELENSLKGEQSKVKSHDSEIKSVRKENATLDKKVKEMTKKLENSNSALTETRKELDTLKNLKRETDVKIKDVEDDNLKLTDLNKNLVVENDNCQKTIEKLSASLDELRASVEETTDTEKSKSDSLNKTLMSKKKKIEGLESKLKAVQADLAEKKKTIKEGQQEMKSLASELKREKTTTSKVSAELTVLQQQYANLEAEIVQLKSDCNIYKDKATNAEKEAGCHQSELKKAKAEFEMQIKELCTTLQMYKADNEKIVESKDREIVQIKEQLSRNDSADIEICKLQKVVSTLTNEMIVVKDASKEELMSKESLISSLNEKVRNGSSEVTSLREELSKLQEALHKKETPTSKPLEHASASIQVSSAQILPKVSKKVTFAANDDQEMQYPYRDFTSEAKTTPSTESKTPKTGKNSNIRITPRLSKETSKTHAKSPEPPAEQRKPILKTTDSKQVHDEKPRKVAVSCTPQRRLSIDLHNRQKNEKHPPSKCHDSFSKQIQRIERKPKEKTALDDEMEQFKDLFPDRKASSVNTKSCKELSTPRKLTPFKSKVKTLTPKQKQKEDTSWFDSDSVFGFVEI